MNRTTPTNHKAWRLLDQVLLGLFFADLIEALHALGSKGGVEDWVNWSVTAISVWGVSHYWKNLFGERNP